MGKSSGLYGPHPLTTLGVSKSATGIGPGAYALGKTQDNVFLISYVGRSDDDLRKRLLQHVPEHYQEFKYAFYPSMKNAFLKECELYHNFNPPDNKVHPARPKGADWTCPHCVIFD